jgi:hypothetical protein
MACRREKIRLPSVVFSRPGRKTAGMMHDFVGVWPAVETAPLEPAAGRPPAGTGKQPTRPRRGTVGESPTGAISIATAN